MDDVSSSMVSLPRRNAEVDPVPHAPHLSVVPSPPPRDEARSPSPIKLSVIMAAFNEERTIRSAVLDVLSIHPPCDLELIVVDDGSSDHTFDILAAVDDDRMHVVRHPTNLGKGTALRTGRRCATGTHVVPFDADGEYSARDLELLVAVALENHYPVVIGTRNLRERGAYAGLRFALGNRLLTRIANVAFRAEISDMHSCLKLVSTDLLRDIPLRETGFGADTELVSALLRRGIRPYEVPISYRGRTRAEGKKIGWRDAVACVAVMGKHRLRSIEQLPHAHVVLDLTDPVLRAAGEGGQGVSGDLSGEDRARETGRP